jgi:hypothetical protein
MLAELRQWCRAIRVVVCLGAAVCLPVGASAQGLSIATFGGVEFIDTAAPVVYSPDDIARMVRPQIGRPCEPSRIEELVASRYRWLGYVPFVQATCADGVLRLRVRESSHRIALVTFDPSDLGRIGLAATRVEDERLLYPVPLTAPRDLLKGLIESRPGDLYNLERDRVDRAALARLGYVLLFIPGPPAEDDEYREGAYLIQSERERRENGSDRPKKVNYLGGNAGYAPRAGASAGLTYSRSDVLTGLDSLSFNPTFNSEWGGDVTYAAPLLAARQAPLRLYDIKISAFSTFIPNRLIDGVEQDQRSTGFSVALGARPLRLQGPNDLRLEGEIRREVVDLSATAQPTDLTLVRLSALHDWRHTFLPPSVTVRTVPSLEVSLGVAGGVPFLRPAIQLFLHSRYRTGFEVDLHLSGGGLDRPVPDFELFSLGGPTTVRGFQEDTRLGRGIAALQSELWIPFARPLEARPVKGEEIDNPAAAPHVPRFIRWVKGAVFLDGGAVWQSPNSGRDALAGAGVGLRFVVPGQPLVVRIDYGWGLGPAGGDAYPYVSLGYSF